jgi:hypothetical protein
MRSKTGYRIENFQKQAIELKFKFEFGIDLKFVHNIPVVTGWCCGLHATTTHNIPPLLPNSWSTSCIKHDDH